jgi:hypothetical protein
LRNNAPEHLKSARFAVILSALSALAMFVLGFVPAAAQVALTAEYGHSDAKNASTYDLQELSMASNPDRPGLRKRIADRSNRRSICKQQASDRGLSGRMERRYTRLCLSGLPVPKPVR